MGYPKVGDRMIIKGEMCRIVTIAISKGLTKYHIAGRTDSNERREMLIRTSELKAYLAAQTNIDLLAN